MRLMLPLLLLFAIAKGQTDSFYVFKSGKYELKAKGASHFASLPLKCIEKEFPYKTGYSLSGPEMLMPPKSIHPAFYGCFDWHSSVHGHWMLIKLLKQFPNLPEAPFIRQVMRRHLSPESIGKELELFNNADNKGFERTYGWAWLLTLQMELDGWDDPDAKQWAAALQPLSNHLSNATITYLNKIVYPIRVGEHSNLAFGLSLMHDYAKKAGKKNLQDAIEKTSRRFYANYKGCPVNWEPGGNDFLSPCLEEANLMRKILVPAEYKTWLKKFMPELFLPNFNLAPGEVLDRNDGKLVHLDGLNLSRAWCLNGIGNSINNPALRKLAIKHLDAALPQVASGSYAGEHWLASFSVYSLTY